MYEDLLTTLRLVTPLKIKLITDSVLSMVKKATSTNVLAFPHLTQCSDMKLLTFGVDDHHSLVITFPVFVRTFNREGVVLYEIETVSHPIMI